MLRAAVHESVVWDALLDLLRDPSDLGQRVGRGWLTRLLVAAAEAEVLGSSGAGRGSNGGRGGGGGERGGRQVACALLPETSQGGGCQLEPGRQGIR